VQVDEELCPQHSVYCVFSDPSSPHYLRQSKPRN